MERLSQLALDGECVRHRHCPVPTYRRSHPPSTSNTKRGAPIPSKPPPRHQIHDSTLQRSTALELNSIDRYTSAAADSSELNRHASLTSAAPSARDAPQPRTLGRSPFWASREGRRPVHPSYDIAQRSPVSKGDGHDHLSSDI